jgi:hypothetical protein
MAFLYSQRRRLPVRTNSADAAAHEIDDLASLAQIDFPRHGFLGGAAQNTDRNVSDASAEGSRVDAPQNPRLIDSDGTCHGHTRCHRAVQKRLGQTQHKHVVAPTDMAKLPYGRCEDGLVNGV